jgi:glycosyltransferase involved in cell wall biosynthesis
MNRKKVLILSPVGDVGGRELEVGYLASIIAEKYDVKVISTTNYSKKSQVTSFKGFVFTSANELIFNKSIYVKIFIRILSFFKKSYAYDSSSLSNTFVKKRLNVELNKVKILKEEILKIDLVFICAQLKSNYVESIIPFAKENNKPIIFRTTGLIEENLDLSYFKFVDLFIHHSKKNAERLQKKYNYTIIDQCCFNEDKFLKIPILESKVNNFMTVSRIEKNKNIDVVINAFCKSEDLKDRLFVVGNGPDLNKIASQTKDERVIFTGFIANDELQKIYKICECFIVSYYKLEAGPLTAIEAMAAGKVIISSKTGAMTERLTDKFAFWHHNDEAHLFQKLREVKKLKIESVKEISERHRNRYISHYSKEIIRKKYIESISRYI